MRTQRPTQKQVERICNKIEGVLTAARHKRLREPVDNDRPCDEEARTLVEALLAAGVVFRAPSHE